MKRIVDISPEAYQKHRIHGEDRCWIETNCYVDVLVELIHGLGFEPIAGLPFTFAIDFEGDQWTFFKYPHADVFELYGLDIQELNPWKSLVEHVENQVLLGRPVLVELDSFFLPDTAGTAYQLEHVKTTVAVNAISVAERRMEYWHNQGYYALAPADFNAIFQMDGLVHDRMLPPYVELVKRRCHPEPVTADALLQKSLSLFQKHLQRAPQVNPFITFKEKFRKDFEWLMLEPIEVFHKYSFATLRQYGACFELCETYVLWLQAQGEKGLDDSAQAFHRIANTAKAFQFQLARAIARKKPMPMEPLDAMANDWQLAMSQLTQRYL